ncbi:MAG: dipeptide epimerase [Planctomycetes bacterium]|nr:dipeptide epimerase [Planctomycetota bacterium]
MAAPAGIGMSFGSHVPDSGVVPRRWFQAARSATLADAMKLTWERLRLRTRHPFRIARPGASVSGSELERVIVRLEHQGLAGFGEAVPVPYYKQTVASIQQTLERAQPLLGDSPEPIEPIVDRLLHEFDDQRATVAAIDAALHDLVGKRRGQPVFELLGLDPAGTPPTSMTIGIDTAECVQQKVAEAAEFGILKIKVGTADDHALLELIRQAAPDKRIRVDANCAWDVVQAEQRIPALAPYDLELVEQPLPPGRYDDLRRLRASLPPDSPPVIADEDCVRPADVARLVGAVDGINIKLSKCGGLVEALRMIREARASGLAVMLGCMVETTLGIAAAAHLASLVDYVDLDGHLLLAHDPFTGLELEGGTVRPGPGPGLGVSRRTD